MYEVNFDHPYWGALELQASSFSGLLDQALQYDHPCDDTTGCDVANMRSDGYMLVATWRMFGATECPTLAACVEAYPDEFTQEAIDQEEDDWWETIKNVSVYCPECNSVLHGLHVYLDDEDNLPKFCTNCAKSFDPTKARRCGV